MLKMENITVRNTLINLNLEVKEGEFIVIVGENGAGKTTLFNTISGIIQPTRGSIFIADQNVTTKSQNLRSSLVANVFQDPKVGTIGNMSIRENLNMALMRGKKRGLQNCCSENRDQLFKEKLSELGINLEKRLDDRVNQLSGGQRQALSITMALLADSKILLLDEITAALDSVNSEKIMKIVNEKCIKAKKTCLMITHNQDQMQKFGNRVLTLKNGKFY